jgi:hypothetical protein
MPTVHGIPGPYRLFFYSFDCYEPKHVHVRRERMVCKFWFAGLFSTIGRESWRHGMNIVVNDTPRIVDVKVTDESIVAHLVDGRTISVPLAWSWRLSEATPEQRNNYEIIGSGQGVHWPDIDEDISATGMLYGIPARPRKQVAQP